jgi:DNA primase
VTLPSELRPIRATGLTAKFWHYLEGRGFKSDVARLVDDYQLQCALTGRYKDRIIVPFYDGNKLIGWTGRAIINPQEAPRYLSSGASVKETIFNINRIKNGGDILVVVEGPFDALKLDFYGQPLGMTATCVFGVSMTMSQIAMINNFARKFSHTYILFDPDAVEASFNAGDWITGPNITVTQVPEGVEDPGSMSKKQVQEFVRGLRVSPYFVSHRGGPRPVS